MTFCCLFLSTRSFNCLLQKQGTWNSAFYCQPLFTLHSFHIFGARTTATCFYQRFLVNEQFNSEGNRTLYYDSKHNPSQTICLNHTEIHSFCIHINNLYLFKRSSEEFSYQVKKQHHIKSYSISSYHINSHRISSYLQ